MTRTDRNCENPIFGGGLTVRIALASATAILTLASTAAHAAGDVKAGSDAFATECAECHSLKQGKNKKGPSMFAVLGRKSASIEDFKYSEAMKSSGIVWTADQIDAYITLPKKAVPGGTMKFDGIADAKERTDLIEYLSTVK